MGNMVTRCIQWFKKDGDKSGTHGRTFVGLSRISEESNNIVRGYSVVGASLISWEEKRGVQI
jgi:hypothetical protein